jgi:small subunit ribosomal protein S20
MANIKSAKKRAKQNVVRRQKNLARNSAIKTAVKKVLVALDGGDAVAATALLKDAESKMARSISKNLMKKNTVSRKVSRLAKRVSAMKKPAVK